MTSIFKISVEKTWHLYSETTDYVLVAPDLDDAVAFAEEFIPKYVEPEVRYVGEGRWETLDGSTAYILHGVRVENTVDVYFLDGSIRKGTIVAPACKHEIHLQWVTKDLEAYVCVLCGKASVDPEDFKDSMQIWSSTVEITRIHLPGSEDFVPESVISLERSTMDSDDTDDLQKLDPNDEDPGWDLQG